MTLRIFSYPDNYRVYKTLVVAAYNEVKIEVPAFDFDVDRKTPEFLAKFPNGKVPAMDTPHGPLYESGAMMKYVAKLRADTGLSGANFYEAALVEQWVDWCAFEVEPARGAWLLPVDGVLDYNPRVHQEAKKDIDKCLNILNEHLLTNTYLVGNRVTLADIVVATAFLHLLRKVLTVKASEKYENFHRWIDTIYHQPQFLSVIGEVVQCTAEAPSAKKPGGDQKPKDKKGEGKKEGGEGKKEGGEGGKKKEGKKEGGEGKKEGGKKEEGKKEKKVPTPKTEEKKESKSEGKGDMSDLLDPDDDDKPKEVKPKSALDLLPKSPMILDAVKKSFFSEKPYNAKWFEQLWSGSEPSTRWDASGYSVFTCDYKYNSEHKMYFLTCNLLGGYLQRAEGCRKYAFGVLNLLGETEDSPPWKLCGLWIFRGPDIPLEMKQVDDSENYDWVRVDVTTPAGQHIVHEAMVGEKVQGMGVLDRRYFK